MPCSSVTTARRTRRANSRTITRVAIAATAMATTGGDSQYRALAQALTTTPAPSTTWTATCDRLR
jgi:hypothetical protein